MQSTEYNIMYAKDYFLHQKIIFLDINSHFRTKRIAYDKN